MVFATDLDPNKPSARRQGDLRRAANVGTGHPLKLKSVQPETDEVAIASRGISQVASSERATPSARSAPVSLPTPLPLPVNPTLPLGLKILNCVQQGSTVITGVLIAGALVIYGSSVYVDKSANRVMTRLNQLQSDSQQLTSANESIKQSLAEQAAQADSGLEPYEAGDVLFVAPEPVRETTQLPDPSSTERPKPLGY